jgi:hypothetical protein
MRSRLKYDGRRSGKRRLAMRRVTSAIPVKPGEFDVWLDGQDWGAV